MIRLLSVLTLISSSLVSMDEKPVTKDVVPGGVQYVCQLPTGHIQARRISSSDGTDTTTVIETKHDRNCVYTSRQLDPGIFEELVSLYRHQELTKLKP